ncbi:MAG: hypothetical protein RL693_2782 [Verrucomicrobiota bacterium]
MSDASPAAPTSSRWLVRIPEVFSDSVDELMQRLGATKSTKLGHEYHLIQTPYSDAVPHSGVSLFLRWNLPIQHSWPCHPQKMENFIEKAAQALLLKFGHLRPQNVLIGQLNPNPSHIYYKGLASNLRGRVLQLFPALATSKLEVEEQDGNASTLYCLVGKEGLFCGMQSPRESNGLYPGGTKYISQSSANTISRAGAKVAEALHYLLMYRPALPKDSYWLELGASPGGMTSELLSRGYRVTAVDRAPLDARLNKEKNLTFLKSDVATFQPKAGAKFDALLCDLNGGGLESIQQVIRLSKHLKPQGLVIFTLKLPDVETVTETLRLFDSVVEAAARAGLSLLAKTHLSYNRHEFTLFFEYQDASA